MTGKPQPLDQKFPIVDGQGKPTLYFIKWAQQRQLDISEGITGQQAIQLIAEWAAARDIIAGIGLSGGDLSADVTINLSAGIDNLTDVDTSTTPPTDGQALIWDEASGLWIPGDVSGGGPTTPKSNRWRMNITGKQSPGAWIGIKEIQMKEIPGGPNMAIGGVATAQYQDGSNPISNAFDGNTSTLWASGTSAMPIWIEYQFATQLYVNEIVIMTGATASDSMKVAVIEYWDGAAWVSTWGINTPDWASNETRTFTNPFPVLPSGDDLPPDWGWGFAKLLSPLSISASTTATVGAGSPTDAVRNANRTNFWWLNSGQTLRSVTFDMGSSQVLCGILCYQDIADSQGNWQVQASSDNVTYVDLGSPAAWGTSTLSVWNFANKTPYRYWRLTQVSGATSNASWQQGFMFRWGGA